MSAALIAPLVEEFEPIVQAGILALIRKIRSHKKPMAAIAAAQQAVAATPEVDLGTIDPGGEGKDV